MLLATLASWMLLFAWIASVAMILPGLYLATKRFITATHRWSLRTLYSAVLAGMMPLLGLTLVNQLIRWQTSFYLGDYQKMMTHWYSLTQPERNPAYSWEEPVLVIVILTVICSMYWVLYRPLWGTKTKLKLKGSDHVNVSPST